MFHDLERMSVSTAPINGWWIHSAYGASGAGQGGPAGALYGCAISYNLVTQSDAPHQPQGISLNFAAMDDAATAYDIRALRRSRLDSSQSS